jgi:hypothetical protein
LDQDQGGRSRIADPLETVRRPEDDMESADASIFR